MYTREFSTSSYFSKWIFRDFIFQIIFSSSYLTKKETADASSVSGGCCREYLNLQNIKNCFLGLLFIIQFHFNSTRFVINGNNLWSKKRGIIFFTKKMRSITRVTILVKIVLNVTVVIVCEFLFVPGLLQTARGFNRKFTLD